MLIPAAPNKLALAKDSGFDSPVKTPLFLIAVQEIPIYSSGDLIDSYLGNKLTFTPVLKSTSIEERLDLPDLVVITTTPFAPLAP